MTDETNHTQFESGHTVARRYRRRGRAVLAVAVLAGVALALALQAIAGRSALSDVRASANEALALQAATVTGILEKYRLLPPLLARREDIAGLFDRPWAEENRAEAARKAIEIAGFSGAKDVVFADAEGRIFASARKIYDRSSVQETTLFEAAGQGRLGRETRSLDADERAYVFASAVRREDKVAGVIAVYVRFDQIEATWALTAMPIVVTGPEGVIFLGNRPEWQLKSLHGGAEPLLEPAGGATGDLFRAPDGGLVIQAVRHLPLLDWRLHVLADHAPVTEARWLAGVIGLLVAALMGITGWFMVKRAEAVNLRMRRDRASALRLERLVRDRTRALSETNASLAREVDERTRTEEQLRRTQKELVQSAKLAALGQMSATLSHEYNQPLAAIRTYADNAQAFLERGREQPARDALSRIAGLTERMSELSRTLLGFARKPGTAISDVRLSAVVDEALLLAGPRAKKAGIMIRRTDVDGDLVVRGGRVRLTQVVVNLVNNAIDALSGIGTDRATADPEIRISAHAHEGDVALVIADNGPGLAPGDQEAVFEPFYSTKGVGEGIGIGLSIVYTIVKDLGGRIEAGESDMGGARFSVILQAGDRVRETGDSALAQAGT